MLSRKEKMFIFGAIRVALEGLKKELVTRDRARMRDCGPFLNSQSDDVIAVEKVLDRFKTVWTLQRRTMHDVLILVPWVYQNLGLNMEEQDEIDKDLWVD